MSLLLRPETPLDHRKFAGMLPKVSFVLGGAASGKSDLAERLADLAAKPKIYLATARGGDGEMRDKIAAHRARRADSGWRTIEAPLDAARALQGLPPGAVCLLDCVTLWLSNHLLADSDLAAERQRLVAALGSAPCQVIVVSNEVGQGIVPENALARRFRSEQGRLNRDIAARAGLVLGVMAGLPFALKGTMPGGLT